MDTEKMEVIRAIARTNSRAELMGILTPEHYAILREFASSGADDPDLSWAISVACARLIRAPLEVIVQYAEPSPNAGRRTRLWYDPESDKTGSDWIDK